MATKMTNVMTKIRIETKKSFQKHNENNSNQKAVSILSFAAEKMTNLILTHPIGLPPHAPVAQKIADQR